MKITSKLLEEDVYQKYRSKSKVKQVLLPPPFSHDTTLMSRMYLYRSEFLQIKNLHAERTQLLFIRSVAPPFSVQKKRIYEITCSPGSQKIKGGYRFFFSFEFGDEGSPP